MDTVKDALGLVNPHWIAVVGTGMYTHIRQICVIGLCTDEENAPFDPSYASILFIFSVLCLVAEYKLWPRSLKEPPCQLMFVYEMLVSALITNLATRAVWIPLIHVICCLTQESSKWLLWFNSYVGLGRYSFLANWAYYMAKDSAVFHMTFCMALLSFVWMLDATESLDGILEAWSKYHDNELFKTVLKVYKAMATLLSTIWALLLNTIGVTIFQTCFANSMEDEDGEPLLSGPPVTSFIFASGIYTVLIRFNLFPQSLRKPRPMVLFLYEFLVTAFILEFSVACIWTPVDILILTTIPKTLCKIFFITGFNDWSDIVMNNKSPLGMISYIVAVTFFLITLHVTRSVDFTIFTECGSSEFIKHMKNQLLSRIQSELPGKRIRCNRKGCRCRSNCVRCKSRTTRKS